MDQLIAIDGVSRIVGSDFRKIIFKCKNKVIDHSSMPIITVPITSNLQIANKMYIDLLTVFQRAYILQKKKSGEQMEDYLKYELATFSMSLSQNISEQQIRKYVSTVFGCNLVKNYSPKNCKECRT